LSTFEALLLGILQGLTEFLPVSSSGHLTLAQALLGIKNIHAYIFFDIVCHLGTLVSIFIVFHKEISKLLFHDSTRLKQIFLGTLPLIPLVLLLKPIKALFDQTQYLGFFFLITALLLYAGIKWGSSKPSSSPQKQRWRDPLVIGLFQALAILPGVSRSGATISGARLLGWPAQEALNFSFLLAIPAILGGTIVELLQMAFKSDAAAAPLDRIDYFTGFTASMIIGWLSLLLLKRLAAKQQFMYFVWYCLVVGFFSVIYFN
jgi:undecaprenyl-diphosphatase